jgi:hypothetical protein
MHISTNDLHCCKTARLLQLAPSGGRPRPRPPATAPSCIVVPWMGKGPYRTPLIQYYQRKDNREDCDAQTVDVATVE